MVNELDPVLVMRIAPPSHGGPLPAQTLSPTLAKSATLGEPHQGLGKLGAALRSSA